MKIAFRRAKRLQPYRRRRLDPPLFFALPVRLEPPLRLLVPPDDLRDRDLLTLRRDVFFAPLAFDVLAFLLVDRPLDFFARDFVVLRDLPRELLLDFDDRCEPPPPGGRASRGRASFTVSVRPSTVCPLILAIAF